MIQGSFESISVNGEGDALLLVEGASEEHPLGSRTIIHAVCGGRIEFLQTSTTHQTLLCRRCMLRIVIPYWIMTWKKLKEYFLERKKPNVPTF